LATAKNIISDIALQEGIGELPPIGSMVETPSAVLLSEEIAAET
jgi:phosphoenolpyruvate-protein kinase (PTS system EI component)